MIARRLSVTAALLLSTTAFAAPTRPNIVILLADDWAFSDVGAYGGEIATPNIDALAATGVRFANFHVAGSCAPTRAMLQTGISSHRAGLGNMPETIPPEHRGRPGYETHLKPGIATIADRLRAAGYRTYLTGKWHLGHTPDTLPTARGYDHALALSQSGADNFEAKPNLLLYEQADWTDDGKPATLPERFYSSTLLVDRMIRYIDNGDANKPFLASINFLANHIPIQAADADIARYKGRYDTGWTAMRQRRQANAIAHGVIPPGSAMVTMATTPDWNRLTPAERATRARALEAYAAMATAMDREVGRLVAHLKATGAYDNTVFVFLSDNGAEATDPMAKAFTRLNAQYYYDQSPQAQGRPGSLTAIGAASASAAASPLSGYKFTASEGGLRVPLILAWPGNPEIRRNTVAPAFTHVLDIAPTLLALTGSPVPRPMTGHSLVPLLTGTAATIPRQPLGYELSGNAVLFKGDLKLVKNLAPYGDAAWHLYDIARDPGETRDLAASLPAAFKAMQAEYAAYAAREGVLAMPADYSAPDQIEANALDELLWPRLRRLLPYVAAAVGLLIGGTLAWRRRKLSAAPPATPAAPPD